MLMKGPRFHSWTRLADLLRWLRDCLVVEEENFLGYENLVG